MPATSPGMTRERNVRHRRPARHPRHRRELGAVARRAAVGPLPHAVARRRADVGDLVSGHVRGLHRRQPAGLTTAAPASITCSAAPRSTSRANGPSPSTKLSIAQRAQVDGVLCDVTCWGRAYDFLEKRDGRWGIVLRRHIYEKDRIDPVDPARRADARSRAARALSGRLPPPRLSADAGRLRREEAICPASKAPHSTRSMRTALHGLQGGRSSDGLGVATPRTCEF